MHCGGPTIRSLREIFITYPCTNVLYPFVVASSHSATLGCDTLKGIFLCRPRPKVDYGPEQVAGSDDKNIWKNKRATNKQTLKHAMHACGWFGVICCLWSKRYWWWGLVISWTTIRDNKLRKSPQLKVQLRWRQRQKSIALMLLRLVLAVAGFNNDWLWLLKSIEWVVFGSFIMKIITAAIKCNDSTQQTINSFLIRSKTRPNWN